VLKRQEEVEHAQRIVGECPFCERDPPSAELWYDPSDEVFPFQVRCRACGACGPRCDCGEESAVPSWLKIAQRNKEPRQ
jgi:hypothetical protein